MKLRRILIEILSESNRYIFFKIKDFTTSEGKFTVYDVEKNIANLRRPAMFTVLKDKKGYIVRNVIVPDELQRKGIATEFYKFINDESIRKTKNPLRSTQSRTLSNGKTVHELSSDGIRLWDSLVSKGLAVKISEKNYKFI